MKIKITLIAFFAAAMLLTSCMKNEVSPGIESVRTAYAAFLNAKAQAEVIRANADAALTLAQAEVEKADAAYRIAQAKGVDAETAQALEALKQAIEMNKVALAAAKRAEQALLDAYNAAVQLAKNNLVTDYFTKYKAALTEVNTVQDLIYDKQKAILDLKLDLLNGTDLGLTNAKAALAAKQARLATLQAELAAAKAILGNVAAANAKVAQLQQDSSTLENTLKTLVAEMTTQSRLIDSTAYKGKVTSEATKKAAYDLAVIAAQRDTAAARFLRDSIMNNNLPSFWKKALDSVANTQARLAANAADTTASGIAYRNALAVIALGTSDLDAMIASKIDSITKYRDTLLAYIADTVAKNTTRLARIADTVQVRTDTATWNAQIKVYHDSADAQRARGADPSVAVADSAFAKAQVDYAVAVRIPTTRAAWLSANTAFNTSKNTWTTKAGVKTTFAATPIGLEGKWLAGTMGAFREEIRARLTTTQGLLTGRQAAIATATANLPDLRSDYLYHLTFNVPLQQAVTLALAYKESVRTAYETWRDAYYTDTYLVGLDADVASKLAAWNTAKEATATAKTALEAQAANIEWKRLNALKTTATTDLGTVKALIPLWKAVVTGQGDFLAAFETAVTNAATAVTNAEAAVDAATTAYETGRVNYDKYTADMVELNARLTAAQAQVVFWKALLDEAIAAAN